MNSHSKHAQLLCFRFFLNFMFPIYFNNWSWITFYPSPLPPGPSTAAGAICFVSSRLAQTLLSMMYWQESVGLQGSVGAMPRCPMASNATAILVALALCSCVSCAQEDSGTGWACAEPSEPWCNVSAPLGQRVESLLSRMTFTEKVAQLQTTHEPTPGYTKKGFTVRAISQILFKRKSGMQIDVRLLSYIYPIWYIALDWERRCDSNLIRIFDFIRKCARRTCTKYVSLHWIELYLSSIWPLLLTSAWALAIDPF